MPTISNIIQSGTNLTVNYDTLIEPFDTTEIFRESLGRFGDNYDLTPNSHLYRFLYALCGEAGVGGQHRQLLYPRMQQALGTTHFYDLDRIYGNVMGISRNPDETYDFDPRNDALTSDEWADVHRKDSSYRYRCLTWMRALIHGGSPIGISLAAEAALGVQCDVYEQYHYLENAASDAPITVVNFGSTNSYNEFIIVPRLPSITQEERRQVIRLVDRLRPVNSIVTVAGGNELRTERPVVYVAATSERFNVRYFVTGRSDVNWSDTTTSDARSQGLWIDTNENEAPTFAFGRRQEAVTYISIQSVTASTEQIGNFNAQQKSLFAHLNIQVDPFFTFDANLAFNEQFAPISITVPWTGSS
jgi:hypothetical protein